MIAEDLALEAISANIDNEGDDAPDESLDETVKPTFIPPPVLLEIRLYRFNTGYCYVRRTDMEEYED
ncbi:hypothetical protein M407DRAFT_18897 [Tulasnella calospora MUT 4182]|uniref:Uncharacterized protein n=1 Tax=Tulasnella calospora MUT 4182 TaxID=1051891 RepID=A0A0C3QIV4_9AGAM|nr:hypothetical protein M407DRAFT_18897 [Tulasnella calospora MUT 4182]